MDKNLLTMLNDRQWLIEPNAYMKLKSELELAAAGVLSAAVTTSHNSYTVDGSTAIVHVVGYLMQSAPAWMRKYGIQVTGYDSLMAELTAIANDPEVKDVEIDFNTPGGEVSGQSLVANAIAELNQVKPVKAVITGMCCSAGYWLASQCGHISADENATVGSIGVYCVIPDYSKMAESEGIKVNLVSSGKYKGVGVAGVPVTDEQLDDLKRNIDTLADNFILAVSRGRDRPKSEIMNLADGRCWIGQEAVSVGLVDEIYKRKITKEITPFNGVTAMAEIQVDVQAIADKAKADERERLNTLKAAFPNDSDYAAKCFDDGLTVEAAKAAYCDILAGKVEALQKETDELKAKLAKADELPEPVASSADDKTGDDFMTVAKALAKEKGITLTDAMKRVAKAEPELHAAFLKTK